MSSLGGEIIKLLNQGKSYDEICNELKISKSTINYWFKKTDKKFQEEIRKKRIINWKKRNVVVQKKRKEKHISEEKKIQKSYAKGIKTISSKELLILGASLYWAEGTKKDRWHLQFSNSDPLMVKIMMKFFRKICQVPEEKFYMQLILHQNTEEQISRLFWSKTTSVPENQFKKACFSKSISSKSIRNKNTLPFGTLQIRILDKNIVNRVYGYIYGLKNFAGIV